MTTLHDTYCTGLLHRGYVRLPKRNRYTMYADPSGHRVFFVGANGAVRYASRANAQASVALDDGVKAALANGAAHILLRNSRT